MADLDFSLIAIAKSAADRVGHYSRPDVFQLRFNPDPQPKVLTDISEPLPVADSPFTTAGATS